jgi:uncharacterized protein (DUF58 family)
VTAAAARADADTSDRGPAPARSHVPSPMEGRARAVHRFGVAFGPRFFVLLAASLLWLGPALFEPRFFYAMAGWDLLIVAGWLFDLNRLPAPAGLVVRRKWLAPVALSVRSKVRLTIVNDSERAIRARGIDAVPHQLRSEAPAVEWMPGPGAEEAIEYLIVPRERGQIAVGGVYLRYQSSLGIAERWARVDLDQTILSYPNFEEAKRESLHLVRSSQADAARRLRPIRGAGRLFESLREHRQGDEFRDICWTASARRGKLVTRLYEAERSQPIWLVIDAGRLMRAQLDEVTKLDHAVNAALTLARVALGSGDLVGLLAYGRRVTQCVPPARGSAHLGQLLDHLALLRAEAQEPDHLRAAGRLLADQKQRSLVVWITDVPDAAMMPEVIQAASRVTPRHLLVLVVIGQPDLAALIRRRPSRVDEMYRIAAAQQITHRRDLLLARMRAGGALTIEATGALSPALVNTYLDVKRRNRL